MNAMLKRVISLMLCCALTAGLLPMSVFEAKAAASDPIYVLAGGDFQAGDNGQEDHYYSRINMGNILDKIKETYSTMDGFLFVGDYDGDTHNDSNANAGVAAMMEEVTERYSTLNHDNSVLIEGNHETGAVTGIDPTGGYEFDGYAVYAINETDYCEKQEGKGTQIQTVADNLETWLNDKLGEGYDAPIFVITHVPLAYGTRTYTNGDGLYAKYIFDVLNTAADNGLNIIFMHGHDHAYGADNYLGGEAIYLPVGDKINICEPGDATSWTEETLNFTYMNAGYVGYYNENYYNVTSYEAEKLTMTVFKIENSQVTVERISKDGTYNLKSAGREGFYANSGTCAGIGLTYNTTVYASPQTITLQSNNNESVGTIGNYVGVTGTLTEDVTTVNKGWVTIIEPVYETETKTVFVLVDNFTDGGRYMIVNADSGSGYALNMTDSTSVQASEVSIQTSGNITYIESPGDSYVWTAASFTKGGQTGFSLANGSYTSRYLSGANTTTYSEVVCQIYNDSYLRIRNNSSWRYIGISSNGSLSNDSNANSSRVTPIYIYEEQSITITSDTPTTNGTYGKIVGDLTYTVPYVGYSEAMAMDALKAQIDGYYYEAASTPDSNITGTKVDDSALTWEWVDAYDGTTPGDYAVKISYTYDGTKYELGTAKVIVPATTTYYIAEGNGIYYVDMNTSADDALAVVKAGVTVYSATDANGTNKTAISDDDVTWTWVDTYNGADSGPYTVDISYNGTSLGTVEVKVNVKYETGIEGWTPVGETEATGGTHTYTLDTDGIEYGEEHKYIIVDDNEAIVLNAQSSTDGTAETITINGDTATTTTRDYEYHFIETNWSDNGTTERYELITKGDGSEYLYQESNGVRYGTRSSVKFQVNHHGSGIYDIHDEDGTEWYVYYNGSKWTVSETTSYRVRLYKYTGTTGGTPAGSIYAKLEGNTVYTVDQGTSAYQALAAVKAGITGYLSSSADGSNATEIADSALTWKWKNTYTGNVTGSYWVEISYNGVVLGTVEVQVEPGVINNYPEYPDEGAVKVSKTATGIDFQSSGIAQVEISASGVPIKRGADVIVMLDTSSSMEDWCLCGTKYCSSTGSSHQRRYKVLEESFVNLIAQFKTPGDDGELLDIQVAIADFNGFHGDAVEGATDMTSGTPYDRAGNDAMSDEDGYDADNQAKVYTGNGTLTAAAFVNAEDLADSYALNYTSGTNYDYAFDAIYQMAAAKQAANTEERDLFVVFMSDGAAMQWNYYHSQGNSSLWNNWITGAWTANDLTSGNLACTTHAYYYDEVDHDGDGMRNEHRMANAIKGATSETFEVIRKTSGLGTATGETNMYMVPGLGATMFSIAFDPAQDGNTTVASMVTSIASLASDQTGTTQYYYEVDNADELSSAFTAIGSEIAYAASNARFVDQMGGNFNLQMSTSTYTVVDGTSTTTKTLTPKIEIISYDIYTRQDYLNGTITEDKIGDRKGTYTILETVTFNADGTEAYSDQIGGGTTNILADGTQTGYVKGVIYAKTFLYNTNVQDVAVDGVAIPTGVNADGTTTGTTNVLPSETFYWKLGTVQTSELAMRYYVYLDGSMEGTKEAGSYATNEFAVLYYDNYLGNACRMDTVSPTMAWKEATVSYAFYLVNDEGEIIVNQTTGQTGSFAHKIAVTKPVVYDTVLLNNLDTVRSITVKDTAVLPEGYALYDDEAVYTITINSNTTGSWVIQQDGNKVDSTYVMQYNPNDTSAYSNTETVNTVGYDYTHTVVWFAVLWIPQCLPDAVVIDYGLPVDISVLTNDMFGEKGKLAGVGKFDSTDSNSDGEADMLAIRGDSETNYKNYKFSDTYDGTYGTATTDTENGKIRYTLNTSNGMQMQTYEKFAYAVNYTGSENAGYYYDTVTVIPATTIYYEDSFLTLTGSGTSWETVGTAIDGATQDEDRPGQYSLTDANNIYGYDAVNKGMSTYSLGTAKKVHVDANSYATAEFTFYGTGFDVISLTSNTSGVIAVKVVDADGNKEAAKVVNTYYGYTSEDHEILYTYTNGAWVSEDKGAVTESTVATDEPENPEEGSTYTAVEQVWVVAPDTEAALYQVPVLQIEGLTYGKHTVTITATYMAAMDKTSADGYDLYLDAIRVYDPANDGAADGTADTTIENAYLADGEAWPSYIELRNKLIDAATLGNAATSTTITGLVFIDGDAEVGDAQISDYASYGPNNEVYLAPGQRVAFLLGNVTDNVANIHIGIKSADGEDGTYTITNIAQKADTENNVAAGQYYNAKTYTIDTTTDMYYDLTGWKNDIIVISNTGDRYGTDGIISLTNIKATYKADPNGTVVASEDDTDEEASIAVASEVDGENSGEVTVYMTAEAAVLTLSALNTTVEEETTPDTGTTPDVEVPEVEQPKPGKPEKPGKQEQVQPEQPTKPGNDRNNKNNKWNDNRSNGRFF